MFYHSDLSLILKNHNIALRLGPWVADNCNTIAAL
jgi:hypothetical protein